MTETSPVSTQTRVDSPLEKQVGTIGQGHRYVEMKVIDPATGQVVPIGEPGEICTRGYSIMLGYLDNPVATAEAIDAARWMHTGDQGLMDAEGYLNIVGRIKDMIIRGGINIYPREIEELLVYASSCERCRGNRCPRRPVRRGGDGLGEAQAWRILDRGGTESVLPGKITHFNISYYVKFVDAFPMTVTGKIRQKFLMRKQSIEELGLQQAASMKTA